MILKCEKCQYSTNKKSDYDKHLLTTKHKKNTQKIYLCPNCNTPYNLRQSLHAHKKMYIRKNKIENISNLLSDIESGQLKKDTNKYIAPFFNLDK